MCRCQVVGVSQNPCFDSCSKNQELRFILLGSSPSKEYLSKQQKAGVVFPLGDSSLGLVFWTVLL